MKENADKSGDLKQCPYCMGELKIDAAKCKYCDEWLEEENKKDIRKFGEDTTKGEIRRQIQDRLKESKKSDPSGKQITQKGTSKVEGVKNWWTGQSTGVKALVIICLGVVAFTGIFLAYGTNQGTPAVITNQVSDSVPSNHNNPIVSAKTCTVCGGDGLIDCKKCGGTGYIETENNYRCQTCSTTTEVKCDACKGTGQIRCTNCGGDGITGN
ncbi:MAG: hypothetical protein ACXVHS_04895 [Methanobacterium sp.]